MFKIMEFTPQIIFLIRVKMCMGPDLKDPVNSVTESKND